MGLIDVPERAVRWFDDAQQDRWWLAHPLGTVRKYADDRGSAFAGLMTFQLFLGMLPLLVVVLSVLGWLAADDPELREAVLESTVAQFPLIGDRLEEDIAVVALTGPGVVLTVVGLLWTAAGIYHSMQLAMNQVWNVDGVNRQGFVNRHVRALLLFTLVVAAALGTGFIRGENVAGGAPGEVVAILSALASAALAAALLLGVFRLVVSPEVPTVRLVPAAVLAGLAWEILQSLGAWIVSDRLAQAQDLYGVIGLVVVALFWINLLARTAIFANEWAAVSWRELWPRRIAQPPLTEADRRVLRGLVRNEHRRPEEHIEVTFDERADSA
jgi:YihY family inner membrane protein